jgi:hypothetical protein
MRPLFILFFMVLIFSCCGQHTPHIERTAADYYTDNEDKFAFMVLDKAAVDSFFTAYSPLQAGNLKLKHALKELLKGDSNRVIIDSEFARHTTPPGSSDFEFAMNIVKTTSEKNEKQYFSSGMHYLFFYKCLPARFHYKWVQSLSGDFEFNVTFFNRLRTKCKVFEEHITGQTGYHDEKMALIIEGYNEITPDKAAIIKECILKDSAFNDKRLQPDKDHFLLFLDKVIANQWRLFLFDNN